MEQQNDLQRILERLEANSRKQLLHARLQTFFIALCGICCGVLVLKLLQILPQLEGLISQAELLLGELNTVTKELSSLDLAQMVENINALVTTSQTGVEEALSKINEIDFNAMNQAVNDLSGIVTALSDFIKRLPFGGLL